MEKYIFAPLSITNFSFHLEDRPDMRSRLPDLSVRLGGTNPIFGTAANPEGKIAWCEDEVPWPAIGVQDDSGGAGGFASAIDYAKVLQSISSNDYKLLGPEMIKELFRPQLGEKAQEQLEKALEVKEVNDIMVPGIPMGTKVGYGLGGMIVLEDLEGRRRKGSMNWAGLPNVYWWADREAGVSGVYASQLMPTGDAKSIGFFKEFEREAYKMAGVK